MWKATVAQAQQRRGHPSLVLRDHEVARRIGSDVGVLGDTDGHVVPPFWTRLQ
jgi:hypothetical protein